MQTKTLISMIDNILKEANEYELFRMLYLCNGVIMERKEREQALEEQRQRNAARMAAAAPSSAAPNYAMPFLPPTIRGTWDKEFMDSIKVRHHDLEMEWIQNALDYAFMNDNKILAIKFIRIKTNLGLKEAKDVVDSLCSMKHDYEVRRS